MLFYHNLVLEGGPNFRWQYNSVAIRLAILTPLAHLTELISLGLNGNQISDFTLLAELQKLTTLHLGNNRIRDVTPLAQLSESLEELDLQDNLIRDVTPLANLIRLAGLYLSGNSLEDTSPLSVLLDANPDIYIDVDVKVIKKTEGGLTITASAPQPLTAATLNGGVVTLALSSGDFILGISDELTISGIIGVSVDRTNYASEGKITVELKFEGDVEKDAILTFTLKADAIEDYDGPPLTAEIPVSAGAETESTQLKGDVNGDGIVNIQDLVLVAAKLGQPGTNSADVNGDGVVNIQDLVLVAGALGTSAAAPSLNSQALEMLAATDVKQWVSAAQQLDLTDTTSQRGILFLQQLLIALPPKETALLPNYPNPFNPETWIPYHLSKDTDVTLHIYAVNGRLVRTLTLGYQAAGMYQNRSRAVYWDGKNALGESVASGLYFYTLTAGDFTATRKMLIQK